MHHGNVVTIGVHAPGLLRDLLREVMMDNGVPVLDVPEGVRVSRRSGKMLVQNFNPHGVDFLGDRVPGVSLMLSEA